MTHSDIYTKFMIEYDKANITSSYPSLTKYEIATILDRAYLALIALKLTGNNHRRASLESDLKSIEDLRPLIKTIKCSKSGSMAHAVNDSVYKIPSDLLYYMQSDLIRTTTNVALDNKNHVLQHTRLLPHDAANKFKATDSNLPWIKNPVCFIQGDDIHVLYDTYKTKNDSDRELMLTYIRKPHMFSNTMSNNSGSGNTNEQDSNYIYRIVVDPTVYRVVINYDLTEVPMEFVIRLDKYYTSSSEYKFAGTVAAKTITNTVNIQLNNSNEVRYINSSIVEQNPFPEFTGAPSSVTLEYTIMQSSK